MLNELIDLRSINTVSKREAKLIVILETQILGVSFLPCSVQ